MPLACKLMQLPTLQCPPRPYYYSTSTPNVAAPSTRQSGNVSLSKRVAKSERERVGQTKPKHNPRPSNGPARESRPSAAPDQAPSTPPHSTPLQHTSISLPHPPDMSITSTCVAPRAVLRADVMTTSALDGAAAAAVAVGLVELKARRPLARAPRSGAVSATTHTTRCQPCCLTLVLWMRPLVAVPTAVGASLMVRPKTRVHVAISSP
jgi:hypothetical protein